MGNYFMELDWVDGIWSGEEWYEMSCCGYQSGLENFGVIIEMCWVELEEMVKVGKLVRSLTRWVYEFLDNI